jgi:hypothetical protein
MDFSTNVIIDFGLNLAGYIIVALLVYVLVSRQRRPQAAPAAQLPDNMKMAPARPATYSHAAMTSQPAFVALTSDGRSPRFDRVVGDNDVPSGLPTADPAVSRRENRRAIYREARQLLARGKSRGELLARLPLTEDELEMLSMAGNA